MSITSVSRRDFVTGLGALAAFSMLPVSIVNGAAKIKFGYAAITWEGNDVQAIKEIAELGFPGIQLRSNLLKDFGNRPAELRDLLAQNKIEMVAFSSGGVGIAPNTEIVEIEKHVNNAKFVKAVGGRYLQVTDSARPKDRQPETNDFKQLGHVLTEIGKRATDLGIPVGYHNHMGSLGESPEEVDRIMEAVDPRYIKLELDVAHYQQGGGDPVKAIDRYRDRLLFLHIKDVESLSSADPRGRSYRFVELGRGRVDIPGVFATLDKVKFSGWAVIELDSLPDKSRTAKEYAAINKQYLIEKLGFKI